MSATNWTIVVVAVVVVIVAAVLIARPALRRQRLRRRFGPEYDRAVEQSDDRRGAEHELIEREHRHANLDLHELSAEQKQHYLMAWSGVQQQFVDDPAGAVTAADRLVTTLMSERGYPSENYDQQLADLSVEHTATLDHYRAAHSVATRPAAAQVSTEDMRAALVHYRVLVQDLIDSDHTDKK
ncbi:hypothetical protein GPX89_08635 [Nocardia sp. ET3-3]|uniref:Secreted protein n=1 Tax=Nocardia terrae TaxID=2675851 RepID=A0A7K1USQ9_9NOCA|nr:hypothetical protein [Nocardia terrae]MVU77311.1 hypothetical protein [Nocardia terrae]